MTAAFAIGLALAQSSCDRAQNDGRGKERLQNNQQEPPAAEFGEELPRIAFEIGYSLAVIEHADEEEFRSVKRLRLLADWLGHLQGHSLNEDDRRLRGELIGEAYFGSTSESERLELVRYEALAVVHEICKSLYAWTSREQAERLLYRDMYAELRSGQLRHRFEEAGSLGGASREADAAILGVVEGGVYELVRGIGDERNFPYFDWSQREPGSIDCISAAGHMASPRLRWGLPRRYRELLDDREWPKSTITLEELRELRLDELAR